MPETQRNYVGNPTEPPLGDRVKALEIALEAHQILARELIELVGALGVRQEAMFAVATALEVRVAAVEAVRG